MKMKTVLLLLQNEIFQYLLDEAHGWSLEREKTKSDVDFHVIYISALQIKFYGGNSSTLHLIYPRKGFLLHLQKN